MAKPSKVLGVAAGVGCLQPGGKGKVCILENNKVVQQRIKFFSCNRKAVMAKPSKVLGVAARGGRHGVPQYPAGVGWFSSIQTPVDRNYFTVDIRCFR